MTEKSKHQRAKTEVFKLYWETEDGLEEERQEAHEEGSDEDDFEGHASGFHRPEQL